MPRFLTGLVFSLLLSPVFHSIAAAADTAHCNMVMFLTAEGLEQIPQYQATWFDVVKEKMLFNISPYADPKNKEGGFIKGAIVAAQSRKSDAPAYPDYEYHWIRDAGITWTALNWLIVQTKDPVEKQGLLQKSMDVLAFLRKIQNADNRLGKAGVEVKDGERRYFVNSGGAKYRYDGTLVEEWMNPQPDGWGYALKGSFGIIDIAWEHWFELFDRDSPVRTNFNRGDLYNPEVADSKTSIIKMALEYLSHVAEVEFNADGSIKQYPKSGFDMWEEEFGVHFATVMAQQAVLTVEAPEFTEKVGDPHAGGFYHDVGVNLDKVLLKFWDEKAKVIRPTINLEYSLNTNNGFPKTSGLDSQVLIGLDHGKSPTFTPASDYSISSSHQLEMDARKRYPINRDKDVVLLGRYPEDIYSGAKDAAGNAVQLGQPWFLTTFYEASLDYKRAAEIYARGELKINDLNIDYLNHVLEQTGYTERVQLGATLTSTDALFSKVIASQFKRGDKIMSYVMENFAGQASDSLPEAFGKYLSTAQGLMAEQIDPSNDGVKGLAKQRSAPSLTWSYAAFFRAVKARQESLEHINGNPPGSKTYLITKPRHHS